MQLFVSQDCGVHYQLDQTADTIEELQSRMKELDDTLLRYYVENEDGELVEVSNIHKSVIRRMFYQRKPQ